jgi:hypothetical protein
MFNGDCPKRELPASIIAAISISGASAKVRLPCGTAAG